MMLKQRDQGVDLLKGITIMLVVLGHSIQFMPKCDFDNCFLFRFIYSFHMPLFMFLSGYIAFSTFDGSLNVLKRKFFALCIPFLIWFLIAFLYKAIGFYGFHNSAEEPLFLKSFFGLLMSPDNGLWFLWVLFLNFLLLFVAFKIRYFRVEVVLFILFMIVNLVGFFVKTNIFGVQLLKWHFLFFALGFVFYKYKGLYNGRFFKSLCIISCLIFPVLVLYWTRIGPPLYFMYFENGSLLQSITLLYKVIVPISGIFFMLLFSRFLVRFGISSVNKGLIFIGKITLEIYAIHFFLLNIFHLPNDFQLGFKILISFLVALIGSILLGILLQNSRFAMKVLFGK